MVAEMPANLRRVRTTELWAIGQFDRCVVMVWCGQPTNEAFEHRAAELVELCRSFPGRCALVEVVEQTSRPPSDRARRVAMEVFEKLGRDLSAIVFTLEGSPIRTTLNRAIITGMLFFVKQPQPTKVFGNIAQMSDWVRDRICSEDPHFTKGLADAIEYLRAGIGGKSPH
jgi:hypothetical protein